jgi:hypothetical protein
MSKTIMIMAGGTGGHIFLPWRWRTNCTMPAGAWSG